MQHGPLAMPLGSSLSYILLRLSISIDEVRNAGRTLLAEIPNIIEYRLLSDSELLNKRWHGLDIDLLVGLIVMPRGCMACIYT